MNRGLVNVLAVVMVVMFMAGQTSAAPVTRFPVVEDEGVWVIGAEADFLLGRDDEDGDEFDGQSYGLNAGYAVNDRFYPYLSLGVMKLEYDDFSVETDTDLVYGAGAVIRLFASEDAVSVDLDARFRYSQSEMDVPPVTLDSEYYDWQTAVTVSKAFESMTPYIGIKYSDFKWEASLGGLSSDVGADDVIGVYAGVDVAVNDTVTLGLQGRALDEEAVLLNVDFRF